MSDRPPSRFKLLLKTVLEAALRAKEVKEGADHLLLHHCLSLLLALKALYPF